jgi:mannose-6-phosphate isomerase-like protein (cupin superfamily)
MFITRQDQVEKEIVHQTGAVYWLVPEGSMREATESGSFFDFISEFTLEPGTQLEPHHHDTFEFYYVLEGEAVMQVEREAHVVIPGDLIRIPRNARHSIWPTEGNSIRCLCVATSFQAPGERFVPCDLPRVEPSPRPFG